MKDFFDIYSDTDKSQAKKRLRLSVIMYCAASAAIIGVCAAFVLLYVEIDRFLWLSVTVNFILTVSFFWLSVLFFCVKLKNLRAENSLYRAFDNAEFVYRGGVFTGENGARKLNRIEYSVLGFDVNGERAELLLRKGSYFEFATGKKYELKTMGDVITAVREVEKDD